MPQDGRMSVGVRIARWMSLATVSALLVACGGAGSPAAPASTPAPRAASSTPAASSSAPQASTTASSKPLKKVTLRLDWTVSGYHAPFVVAADMGFYKQAGLDVAVKQGKGSATTVQVVANGVDAFGYADAGATATLISKGAPVKVLAVFTQQSPSAFIYNPPFKLTNLHQLMGKTILDSAGSAISQLFPAVLATAGLKVSQVHINYVDAASWPGLLKENPKYVVLGFDDDELQSIQQVDPQAVATPWANFGVNTLSTGLITSTKMIREHPGEVRRFVAASVKGWQYTIAHPRIAIDDLVKRWPTASKTVQAAELKQSLTMLHTPNSTGKPIGWMSPKDWQNTIALLHEYGSLKTVKPMSDYYTNSFLPAQ